MRENTFIIFTEASLETSLQLVKTCSRVYVTPNILSILARRKTSILPSLRIIDIVGSNIQHKIDPDDLSFAIKALGNTAVSFSIDDTQATIAECSNFVSLPFIKSVLYVITVRPDAQIFEQLQKLIAFARKCRNRVNFFDAKGCMMTENPDLFDAFDAHKFIAISMSKSIR